MSKNNNFNRGTVLLAAFALAGCEGMVRPDAPHSISIASNPPGARVIASGRDIGTTPLKVVPGDVFDSGFAGMTYRYKGRLELRKPGCEPHDMAVNDSMLKADISVQLTCDPNYVPEPAASGSVPHTATPTEDAVEQRLERIERLHQRGVLSDEEYRSARKRIIDTL